MSAPPEVHYEIEGEGEPLLVAGGWTVSTPEKIRGILPRTCEERRLITFHYRGLGESHGARLASSTAVHAADARDVLADAGIERAQVVGIGGMGGCVVLQLAGLAPHRVNALVAHEARAFTDTATKLQFQAMRDMREKAGFDAYQRLAAVLCFTPAHINASWTSIKEVAWGVLRDKEEVHLRFLESSLSHDVRGCLAGATMPSMFVSGDDTDLMTGARHHAALLEEMPHAETRVMEGTPHAWFESDDAKALLDEIICDFLDRNPVAA